MSEELAEPAAPVLGIDGALGAFSVALVSPTGAFAPRSASGDGRDALERGLGLVGDVLAGLPLVRLGRIVVTTGPGSFTGLRIAVAYAKSLAFAAGVPLVGLDAFDALEPEGDDPALVAIPSRAGRANVRLRIVAGEPRVAAGGTIDEVARAVASALPAGGILRVTELAAGVAERLGELGVYVILAPPSSPIATVVALRGLHRAPLPSPHALVASYGEGYVG